VLLTLASLSQFQSVSATEEQADEHCESWAEEEEDYEE